MPDAAYLVMVNIADKDWSHKIDDQRKIIGRSTHAHIRIPQSYASVSRRHSQIWRDASGIWLQDLRSRVGTRVNGVFLKSGQAARIAIGDRIALDELELNVREQVSKLAEVLVEAKIEPRLAAGSLDEAATVSVHVRPGDMVRMTLETLSPAELEVLLWMYRGYVSDAELGNKLCRSPHTIRTQVGSIFEKVKLHSRTDLVTWLKRAARHETPPARSAALSRTFRPSR